MKCNREMIPISDKLSRKISNMALVCSCLVVFIHLQEPTGGGGVYISLSDPPYHCCYSSPVFLCCFGLFSGATM